MESRTLGIAHGVWWVNASASLAHGVRTADVWIYDTKCILSGSLGEREAYP